jgi:histidine triad (HIT) family protein
MNDCIFCKIISGEIPGKCIYQDSDFIVIHDIHPQAPVHMLVIPKTHVTDYMRAKGDLLQKLSVLLKKLIQEKHVINYRLVTNGDGAAVIEHFHVHLMGQIAGDRDL